MLDNQKRLLTVKEVLEITQTSRNQLYRDISSGKIKPIHFGVNVRFYEDDVAEYARLKMNSTKVQQWKKMKNSTPPEN